MFNLFDYGAVMKKKLYLSLMLISMVAAGAFALDEGASPTTSTEVYTLDEQKAEAYQLEQQLPPTDIDSNQDNPLTTENITGEAEKTDPDAPRIITEETADGRVEKLMDKEGRVIAEKTIKGDTIVKKVLNYYYPTGQLMRQVTAKEDDSGFYAEEFYPNGKTASEVSYINDRNKIGKEKRYDANGVLRQEVTWGMPEEEEKKPLAERRTVRQGKVITYYPDGKKAAVFALDNKGKTIFYNQKQYPIREIIGGQILNFDKELTEEDCKGTSIRLDIEELVELYEDEGDISYNKCGLPYRENFVYEVVETVGDADRKISYDETGMIRKITTYTGGLKDGVERKYDSSGNLSAEIEYKEGIKDGYAKGYFPTKEVAFRKLYENGKVHGMLICYFPTGEVAAKFLYKNGLKEGTAIINSPIQAELVFENDKLINRPQKEDTRQLISILSKAAQQEEQCFNFEDRMVELLLDIDSGENSIYSAFDIVMPKGCENPSTFKFLNNRMACKDSKGMVWASVPVDYIKDDYAVERIYYPNHRNQYEVAYNKKQKQGWSRKYDEKGKIIAEIYFDKGKIAGSSRTYYPNGRVKELMTISDTSPRKIVSKYADDGSLLYSLSYNNKGEKQEAYLLSKDQNKDMLVRYYNGKADSIRESNIENPYNFIEYNLSLGEYAVHKNNVLVKAGKLCHYQQPTDVVVVRAQNDEGELLPESAEDFEQAKLKAETKEIVVEKNSALDILQQLANGKLSDPDTVRKKNDAQEEIIEPIKADQIKAFDQSIEKHNEDNDIAMPLKEKTEEKLDDIIEKPVVVTPKTTDPNTEHMYYPNGKLRKTIKKKDGHIEEVREYSKSGMLLTDTTYNKDKIVIEKYFGTGQVRRRSEKSYDNNVVNAFLSREDFYDTGKPRYEIKRKPETMLFNEKIYYPTGKLKSETEQTAALAFSGKEYTKEGAIEKEIETLGNNTLIKEYNTKGSLSKMTVNGKEVPLSLAKNSADLLKDNARTYNKGLLTSAFKTGKDRNDVIEYYSNGNAKTEIIFYNNGEISVKAYGPNANVEKHAYLAQDGKLHIEKPVRQIVPAYRERYWVDYNNPYWVENEEKYSVKSIARLNLDVAAYMLAELGIDVPDIMKKLYEYY